MSEKMKVELEIELTINKVLTKDELRERLNQYIRDLIKSQRDLNNLKEFVVSDIDLI